jgi:hypothetical protein
MRRLVIKTVLAGMAAVGCGALLMPASAAAVRLAPASAWSHAKALPGLRALNAGGFVTVTGVSCTSAGNCAVGGSYTDGSHSTQAYVASERNGRWGKAKEVPGSATLNADGDAQVTSVSCRGSAGNCAAGGFYTDGSHHKQAFVISERNGRWGKAIEVPGSGTLNADGYATTAAVSCGSAGNCTAGGNYRDGSYENQAFLVRQRNGRWGNAVEVPGSATLNADGGAQVISVSCPSAGNCAAGGLYLDGSAHLQAFVVSERNGHWANAIEVPGSAALNSGNDAEVDSVSCTSAGNCAAGGYYTDSSADIEAFVVGERNGHWANAIEVPGSAALNSGDAAEIFSVSCSSAGNCAAGGFYTDSSTDIEAFVVGEHNGHWANAIEVPGSAALNSGNDAEVFSVSCPSAGNCVAGGFYTDSSATFQALVASERNGHWGNAIEVPGSGALNSGGAEVKSVSCTSVGKCGAAGIYTHIGNTQGLVVSRA